MQPGPDFIGLGAQRAGTSWIYSCLYEHPDIYAPVKEIHFFSRDAAWSRGYEWYESTFTNRPPNAKAGELSTSYLSSPKTPERIKDCYPNAKLFVSLRNPVERAYSNYLNDLVAGRIKHGTYFSEALSSHPEYVDQGMYATQLHRFQEHFPPGQILILVYEDSLSNPVEFIQRIYRFIGVDSSFVPSLVHSRVNKGRAPRFPSWDRLLRTTSYSLRKWGLNPLWWRIKKTGLSGMIRTLNTRQVNVDHRPSASEQQKLYSLFENEISRLEQSLERDLKEWRY